MACPLESFKGLNQNLFGCTPGKTNDSLGNFLQNVMQWSPWEKSALRYNPTKRTS